MENFLVFHLLEILTLQTKINISFCLKYNGNDYDITFRRIMNPCHPHFNFVQRALALNVFFFFTDMVLFSSGNSTFLSYYNFLNAKSRFLRYSEWKELMHFFFSNVIVSFNIRLELLGVYVSLFSSRF